MRRRRPIRAKAPRRARSRWNPDKTRLEKDLEALEAQIKGLNTAIKAAIAAKNVTEEERLIEEREGLPLRRRRLRDKVAKQKKQKPKLAQAQEAGRAPVFAADKQTYEALKSGELRFLSEHPGEARRLGIEEDEVVRSAVSTSKQPLEWFFVRVFGLRLPAGVNLENHQAGNTVYEFFKAPPEGANVRSVGPILPPCKEATNLDLNILPTNPAFAKRYVMSVLVWMSDQPEVSALIEEAPTQIEALRALRDGVEINGLPLHIPPHYTKDLLLLNLDEGDEKIVNKTDRSPESPKWKKFRKEHAAKMQDRYGESAPRFGFYDEILGPAGTLQSLVVAFGAPFRDCLDVQGYHCRQYSNGTIKILPGSKASVGTLLRKGNKHWSAFTTEIRRKCGDSPGPGTPGVPSLSCLLAVWEGAQRAFVGQKVHPSFYRAPTLWNGAPVALVIAGPRGHEEGYLISGDNPTVQPLRNMVALGEALLWGNPAHVARQTCFLLPPEVITGWALKKEEITGAHIYEKSLVTSPFSPLTHFRTLASEMDLRDPASLERAKQFLFAGPEFFQAVPRSGWISFFGEVPQVQAWPGVYLNIVKHGFQQGYDRTAISGWMVDNDQHLHNYRDIGEGIDLTAANSEFGPQRRVIEGFTIGRSGQEEPGLAAYLRPSGAKPASPGDEPRKIMHSGRERLHIHHLTACAWADVDFSQNLLAGTPGYGAIIPTRVVLHRRGQREVVIYDMEEIRLDHHDTWWKKPNRYAPPIRAKVMLINTALAIEAGEKQVDTGENPIMSPSRIKALLRTKALMLGSEQWFLALPRAEIGEVVETLEEVPGKKGAEPQVRTKREMSWFDSYYYGSRPLIPLIARNLLRVGVSTVGVPHLVPVASDPPKPGRAASSPWTSRKVPYLFTSLPVAVRGEDGKWSTQMLEPGEAPLPNGYFSTFVKAFNFSKRSASQKGAIQSVIEGSEIEGKREHRGQPTEATRVATKRAFKGSGFYWLAQRVVQDLQLGGLSAKPKDQEVLYAAMRPAWPLIVAKMNEGLEEDEQHNPAMPFPFKYGKAGDPDLEREALAALSALLDPEYGDLEVLFAEDDLIHPSRYGLTGEDAETMGDFFHRDVHGMVKTIENPRRRRRRRRRKRRGRRSRESRHNPWTDAERISVADWATKDKELGKVSFSRPKTNEEMFSAVEEVYPLQATTRALAAGDRLDALALSQQDLFGSFRAGAVDDKSEAALRKAILSVEWGKDDYPGEMELGEEAQAYLARHADLSLVEGKQILDERRRSKRRASMVTPSGAICKMNRNTARLKDYTPKLPVMQPGTAWILVGPPVKEGGLTRIMSFRNGGYIDCDMLVPANQPLSFFLGKAIQGMVMWLAEKKIRTIRMQGGLHIGLIGSAQTRQLWAPGDRLDVPLMLSKAYKGEVTLRMVEPGDDSPDKHVRAGDKAKLDFKKYAEAQRKVAPPTNYPSYRRAAESKQAAAVQVLSLDGDK